MSKKESRAVLRFERLWNLDDRGYRLSKQLKARPGELQHDGSGFRRVEYLDALVREER